jgi:hypothetical protein
MDDCTDLKGAHDTLIDARREIGYIADRLSKAASLIAEAAFGRLTRDEANEQPMPEPERFIPFHDLGEGVRLVTDPHTGTCTLIVRVRPGTQVTVG